VSGGLHIGLLINPLAGLGGSLALKGSDGNQVRELAVQLLPESRQRAQERTVRALRMLQAPAVSVSITSWAGDMGESALQQLDFNAQILGSVGQGLTTARDTRVAVEQLCAAGVDIIVFAGGDGTARDIYDVVGAGRPVVGIPAGVKMHSGVFAVSPEAAGELLLLLAQGGLVGVRTQQVRDIDEDAFRHDVVRSRFYGDLLVPSAGHFLQHTKVGGREDSRLASTDIAAWQVENMASGHTYLIGPGSTTAAIMEALKLPNTLLGVDVVRNGKLLAADADEQRLLQLLADDPGPAHIVVTAIGGQGHLFGRGNQQFSPAVIRAVGVDNLTIVAAKSKIAGLEGRPLLVDTNDIQLDSDLCGLRMIITGYDDHVLYRISTM
jgi:predicted polyphosphate/ATP-dependent NAD kinase